MSYFGNVPTKCCIFQAGRESKHSKHLSNLKEARFKGNRECFMVRINYKLFVLQSYHALKRVSSLYLSPPPSLRFDFFMTFSTPQGRYLNFLLSIQLPSYRKNPSVELNAKETKENERDLPEQR